MMLQLILGTISVSDSNIDIGENQTQKCVFLRDSYNLPVLFKRHETAFETPI